MEYKLIYIVLFNFLVYLKIRYILHLYEKIFLNGEKSLQELYTGEYTGGHYKRGVE